MQYGAGSVALRIGGGEVIARFVGSASSVTPFVDHFRAEGQKYDYQWEERWIRDEGYLKIVPETVERLLKSTGTEPGAIDCFCLPSTIAGAAAAVAKRLKLKPEAVVDALAARCGDTGAAHTLMLLAAALESARPGQKILLVGFGTGCDALLFEATEAHRAPQAGVRCCCSDRPRRHREELQQVPVVRGRARSRLGDALGDGRKDRADAAVPCARTGRRIHRRPVPGVQRDPVPENAGLRALRIDGSR